MQATVSELSGAALDWAVAKCEYDELAALNIQYPDMAKHYPKVSPSTDWAQGGPIIEREEILLRAIRKPGHSMDGQWLAMYDGTNTGSLVQWRKAHYSTGPTPLIAAMRCLVKIKLGDEIEVPDFLANMTV